MPTKIYKEQIGGLKDGRPIHAFSLANDHGIRATFLDFGGILIELEVPDRRGIPNDITLGFDSIEEYVEENAPFFGAIVGRFANRINKGKFTLDGKSYKLPVNDTGTKNHLHGGPEGFAKKLFQSKIINTVDGEALQLSLSSQDGEMGYPGKLDVTITISLTEMNGLVFQYKAITNKPTIVNFTTHPYFNLISNDAGSVRSHKLQIFADHFLPTDSNSIPTGSLESVSDGPFDFREPFVLDPRLDSANPQIDKVGGFDHTFALHPNRDIDKPILVLSEDTTGRKLEVFTTEPGIQVYTGNSLDGTIEGKNGFAYPKHAGIALETQHFPDSPNHENFPSTRLNPGEIFSSRTEYRFSTFE